MLLVLRESLRSFARNRGLETAATLSYYGFLSLMPLLLLLIFALGWVVDSSEAILNALRAQIETLFPAFDNSLLNELVALAHRRVWGLVGFVVLVWSMTPLAAAARNAIVNIFKGENRPTFLRGKVMDFAAVLSLLLLLIVLTASRVALVALPPELTRWMGGFHALFAWLLSVAVICVFYKAFAPAPLRWREALEGAVVVALLLSVIRPLFGLLLQYNPNFGYAFGSVKAIFLLLVWAHYTFAALLFGAEVAANVRRREAVLLRGFLASAAGAGATGVRASQRLLRPFLRHPAEGTRLFDEGDEGHEMYFIRSGAIRLTRGGIELSVLHAGDYFGEMSMLLGSPRAAAATVVEADTELVAISARNMDVILRENPAVVQRLLRDMSVKLQAMNERLTP